jgi:hypothetical protein
MPKAVSSSIAAPAAAPYTPILDACPYTSPHAGTMGLHCTHVGSGVTHCGVLRLRRRWFGTALTHHSRWAVLRTSGRVATTRPLSVAAQHIGPLTCITAWCMRARWACTALMSVLVSLTAVYACGGAGLALPSPITAVGPCCEHLDG